MISMRKATECIGIQSFNEFFELADGCSMRAGLCGDVFGASSLAELSLRQKLSEIEGPHIDLTIILVSPEDIFASVYPPNPENPAFQSVANEPVTERISFIVEYAHRLLLTQAGVGVGLLRWLAIPKANVATNLVSICKSGDNNKLAAAALPVSIGGLSRIQFWQSGTIFIFLVPNLYSAGVSNGGDAFGSAGSTVWLAVGDSCPYPNGDMFPPEPSAHVGVSLAHELGHCLGLNHADHVVPYSFQDPDFFVNRSCKVCLRPSPPSCYACNLMNPGVARQPDRTPTTTQLLPGQAAMARSRAVPGCVAE